MSESQQIQDKQHQSESNRQASPEKQKTPKKTKRVRKNKKQGKGPSFISSTYRKEKCEFFNKGNCTKGDLCTYSHDFEPDTARKICKYFLGGSCSKGITCQYSHNTKIYPCKFYHIENKCQQGNNCKFSHNPIPADFFEQYMKDNKDHILKVYKQNRLLNKDLLEFIQADLPKRQLEPPPIMSASQNTAVPNTQPLKSQGIWINTLKKDPRQRIAKNKPQQSAITPTKAIKEIEVKKQQQKLQAKQQNLQMKLLSCLKQYFYSYY